MLNYIWMGLVVAGVFVAGLLGRISGADSVAEGAFSMAKVAITLALGLVGGMMLWLGMLRLADRAGFVRLIARSIRPVMTRLFPDVPAEHPAMGAMIMNMAANMLGLGNAATPLGLKAMQELNKLNPVPGTATNAMCTFLAINTSSVTLIPATALIYVSAAGVPSPFAIVVPAILATTCSTIVAIFAVKFFQRLPGFRVEETGTSGATAADVDSPQDDDEPDEPVTRRISPRGWVLVGIVTAMMGVVTVFEFAPGLREGFLESSGLERLLEEQEQAAGAARELKDKASALESEEANVKPGGWRGAFISLSALIIPLVFVVFTVGALIRGVRVYEEFVEGAKEGWEVAIRIMPFLVAILVAMGIFRDSGALMLLQWALSPLLSLIGFPPELLPMALMRPLSGSGSSGVLAELLSRPVTDIPLVIKYTAATMFGSTETTFYVLAVYFGSVAIRKTRHALAAGLCADAAGVIAAVVVCRFIFG